MITIVHISDLHFGRPGESDAEKVALLDRIRQKFHFGCDNGTYLALTGDFVDAGQHQELSAVSTALRAFSGAMLACPGNHDYGYFGISGYESQMKKLGVPPEGATGAFAHKVPVVKKLNQGDVVVTSIGLNSTTRIPGIGYAGIGEVGEDQREALDALLNLPRVNGEYRIVYMHHRPEHCDGNLIQRNGLALLDKDKVLELVRGRVDALLFGHDGNVGLQQWGPNGSWWSNADKTRRAKSCNVLTFGPGAGEPREVSLME